MSRRRAALLGVLPFATLVLGLVAAAPAGAAAVGGLGVRPAHSDPADPATKAYFKPVIAPGGTFSDAVTVTNSSDAPMTLFVTPVDGLTSTGSGAVYANRQDPVEKAGRWVAPATGTVTVPPQGSLDVPFTVRVPGTAVPGDHLAGIAVEDAHPHSSGGTFSVTEIIRAVVGIQIQVPGAAAFTMTAGTPSLAKLPGTSNAAVTIPLVNTGGLLGKPALTVSLAGDGYSRTVTRALDTVLPGDHIDYPFVWPDDVRSGSYAISVSLTAGHAVTTTQGHSTIGQVLDGAANPGAAKQTTVAAPRVVDEVVRAAPRASMPWLLMIGIAIIALLVGALGRRMWAFSLRRAP